MKLHILTPAAGLQTFTPSAIHVARMAEGGIEVQLPYFDEVLKIVKLELDGEEALNLAAKLVHEVEMKMHREAREAAR